MFGLADKTLSASSAHLFTPVYPVYSCRYVQKRKPHCKFPGAEHQCQLQSSFSLGKLEQAFLHASRTEVEAFPRPQLTPPELPIFESWVTNCFLIDDTVVGHPCFGVQSSESQLLSPQSLLLRHIKPEINNPFRDLLDLVPNNWAPSSVQGRFSLSLICGWLDLQPP